MIVVLGLPLNVASIILSFIFLVILGPMFWWAYQHHLSWHWQFFHSDVETNVHPSPVSWYFISLLWRSVFLYAYHVCYDLFQKLSTPVVGLFILSKVLTLNVAIGIVILFFGNFCLFEFWFFEHWSQSSNLSKMSPFCTCAKGNEVQTSGLSMSPGNLLMTVLF